MDEQTMSSSNSFATAMCDVGVPFCGYEGFRDTVASSSSLYSSPGGGDVIGSYYCADMMNDTYIDPSNGLALVIAAGVIMCFMPFGIISMQTMQQTHGRPLSDQVRIIKSVIHSQ
jgi:hypothetical protein